MRLWIYILVLVIVCTGTASWAMETSARQTIVVDDSTHTVLFEKNADEPMPPSSMSKLMTVYVVFKKLKEGSLKLTDTLPVSEKAWKTQGSKTFVELGARITVENLLQGIIVQSGNDACVVVAEGLAGSEASFAEQMNDMAKQLGLTHSHFANATGLPDDTHRMSARDLAVLSQHIIHDFPEYYHYFSEKEFVYHGIKQGNRNLLLYKDTGVDGLKTGHTDAGGFGIAVTAKDKTGRRILVVVNGLGSEKERAEEAERLLAYGFRDFNALTILHKGEVLDYADVWFGTKPKVALTVENDVAVTLPKAGRDKAKFTLSYVSPAPAPVRQGEHIADLRVDMPGMQSHMVPLVAAETVREAGAFQRIGKTLRYYVSGQ